MPSASSRAFLEFLVQPLADRRAAQAAHASAVVAPACIRCRINCRVAPYGYTGIPTARAALCLRPAVPASLLTARFFEFRLIALARCRPSSLPMISSPTSCSRPCRFRQDCGRWRHLSVCTRRRPSLQNAARCYPGEAILGVPALMVRASAWPLPGYGRSRRWEPRPVRE